MGAGVVTRSFFKFVIMEKTIAVICPYQQRFKIWVEVSGNKNEEYTFIRSEDDVRGRIFKKVINIDYECQLPTDLHDIALNRVR